MSKYPFVKQEGFKDCGCACILMIVRYYMGNLSIERLRDLTYTNKNGTSAYNIVQAFNRIGFSASGMKGELRELEHVILPCIAHVVIDQVYKHYIVIYEINFDKHYLLIADPSKGIVRLSFDSFSKMWTGIVIVMYPCSAIPYTKSINVREFIFKNIIKYKSELFLLFVLSFVIILLKIISSFYFKFVIDGISVSKSYLCSVFLIFLVLSITKLIINYFRNKFLIILNCKLDFCMTLDAFRRIILLPYRYYHNRTSGEIISKINDLGNSRDIISKICVCLFIDLPLVLITIIFLIRINFLLFLITLFVFILYLLLSIVYNKVFKGYITDIKFQREKVNSFMYEAINGFETVKGIGIENRIINKFNGMYVELLNYFYKLQGHVNTQSFFKDFISDIGNLCIIFVGSLLVIKGKFDFSYLITYTSLMVYFFEPIRNIVDLDLSFKESRESISRVLSLYENYSDKGLLSFRNGSIDFRNLSFSFENDRSILNNISFSINKGDKVMIYGESGSGKSTLLKLLMRYYGIDRGMLFISGIDINDFKISSLRSNIAYVSQNEILFNDSLLNNLKFYCNDNNKIVSMANLFEFNEILDNDLGLNMMVEENGFNLSGGQRQRIILARTFLKQAQIILIDEGLSQIDVDLERRILSNVFKVFSDKTIVIVSHRLENIDLYTRVVKISNGEIYE